MMTDFTFLCSSCYQTRGLLIIFLFFLYFYFSLRLIFAGESRLILIILIVYEILSTEFKTIELNEEQKEILCSRKALKRNVVYNNTKKIKQTGIKWGIVAWRSCRWPPWPLEKLRWKDSHGKQW